MIRSGLEEGQPKASPSMRTANAAEVIDEYYCHGRDRRARWFRPHPKDLLHVPAHDPALKHARIFLMRDADGNIPATSV